MYMKNFYTRSLLITAIVIAGCNDHDGHGPYENISLFTEIDRIQLAGGETAAEISAYDPKTKKLFVINAVKSAIDVIDMQDPSNLEYEREINISAYGNGVNS